MISFSPGSITLFFSIRDSHRNNLRKGSVGVGVVIDRGAVTRVERSTESEVTVNDIRIDDTLQKSILDKFKIKARVSTHTQLPVSQGFGMSAAAAVSTSFALFYGEKSYYECISIAHEAEIEHGSGLGDVASISSGGFTLRLKEGIPPFGFVDRLKVENEEFVVLWMDKPIETRDVIRGPEFRKRIVKAGNEAMKMFLPERNLRNAFRVARRFSRSVALSDNELQEIMDRALQYGEVAQIMIGNSLIAYGKTDSIEKIFEKYGNVARVKIYNSTPILIDQQ